MQNRSFGLLFAFLAGCSLLAGCSRPDEEVASSAANSGSVDLTKPVTGDWVVQRINGDPDSLNPITGEDTNGATVRGFISEGLLQLNNFTLKLEPCLAESWEISPDKLVYTFHLRHGVKWHDGAPFTADDVKYTFDRIQDPKVDCAFLRVYFTTVKACDVLDPYTVRFTTTAPYFKMLETIGEQGIVPKHVLTQGEPDFNKHPFARAPIGTGPYKFVRWDTGSAIVLERNEDYWGPVHDPNRLVFQVIEESYVAAQLLKKGEIDVFDGVSPVQWERELKGTRSMSRCQEITYPFPSYLYIGFNLREPIFSDVRVRHAIDLLVPRDEIISQIYLGKYADKISGYDSPSSPDYNHDVPVTPYDPVLAAQLLDQAGWKMDHGDGLRYKDGKPLSFTLLYPSGNTIREKISELVQESLARQGIDLKLSRLEFAQLISRVDDWKFEAVLAGWSLPLSLDPDQLWNSSQAVLKKSSNFVGYSNPAADKLIAEGKLEYDDEKRAVLYRQLHRIIHDDYPVCFLFNPREIMIVSDRFQNVKIFAPGPCFDISTWWVPSQLQKYDN